MNALLSSFGLISITGLLFHSVSGAQSPTTPADSILTNAHNRVSGRREDWDPVPIGRCNAPQRCTCGEQCRRRGWVHQKLEVKTDGTIWQPGVEVTEACSSIGRARNAAKQSVLSNCA